MKHLLLAASLFLLFNCINANAQDSLVKIDKQEVVPTSKIKIYNYALDFEQTVYLGLSKAELWSNVKGWVSRSFKTNLVIDSEDKDLGRIILKYTFPIGSLNTISSATANSIMQVDVRDGKFRIKLYGQNVEVKLKNTSLAGLPNSLVQTYRNDLENIDRVSKNYFNSRMTWDFNSQSGNELTIGNPYTMALYYVNNANEEIINSLIEALRYKDDF